MHRTRWSAAVRRSDVRLLCCEHAIVASHQNPGCVIPVEYNNVTLMKTVEVLQRYMVEMKCRKDCCVWRIGALG